MPKPRLWDEPTALIAVKVPTSLKGQIDKARGDTPMPVWLRWILERAVEKKDT